MRIIDVRNLSNRSAVMSVGSISRSTFGSADVQLIYTTVHGLMVYDKSNQPSSSYY